MQYTRSRVAFIVSCLTCYSLFLPVTSNAIAQGLNTQQCVQKLQQSHPELNQAALVASLRAYAHLKNQGYDPKEQLTFIDFTKPSTQKRLYVIDMQTCRIQYITYVAHGKNTGWIRAKHFSNQSGTFESSLGVYLTGQAYYGIAGYSLKLKGLDLGFNDRAASRHLVMHPAWYASASFAKAYGRLGHTLGCFGINPKIAPKLINTIKNDTVLVAYYPDPKWLATSIYLKP